MKITSCNFGFAFDNDFGYVFVFGFHGKMVEGIQPLHPRPPEEAAKAICAEGKRPPFKIKLKSYPPDLKE